MQKFLVGIIATTLIASPVQAGDWRNQVTDTRPGAFVGARIRLPLGGGTDAGRPNAALTIAPAVRSVSAEGEIRTRTGEGISLNLASASGMTLTLAGVRADPALGFTPGRKTSAGQKLGLSDAGWVAVGVGGVLLAGAAIFAVATHCDESDSSDDCP